MADNSYAGKQTFPRSTMIRLAAGLPILTCPAPEAQLALRPPVVGPALERHRTGEGWDCY